MVKLTRDFFYYINFKGVELYKLMLFSFLIMLKESLTKLQMQLLLLITIIMIFFSFHLFAFK